MKVLLMDSPYAVFTGYCERFFASGMASIAAILRQAGHEVAIFEADTLRESDDLDFGSEYLRLQAYINGLNNSSHWIWPKIYQVLEEFRPDVVGITAVTMKFGSTVRVAELCKVYNPNMKVIVGGPHATDWPAMSLQSPAVDFNVAGEAEESVLSLVQAIEAGSEDYEKIPGLTYRRNGQTILGTHPKPPRDLDIFPYPARDLLMNPGRYTSEDMGLVLTSRGCPYDCAFCSHERHVRYRSLDNVMGEIRLCIERYRTRQFTFKDDSFTVNRKRTMDFCRRLISEGLGINWECTTRVNLLDDELLELMVKSGLNNVKVGIETGSERILRSISKKASFDQMRAAAAGFNKHHIFWTGYFMYGLPDETFEDMQATFRLMKELTPPHAGLGLYAPYPNTQLWHDGVRLGLINPDVELDHFFNTNPKDYFFADPQHRVVQMSHEELEEAAAWMMTRFNKHNTQVKTLLRRGWTRRKLYLRDWRLLHGDVVKALTWLGLLGRGPARHRRQRTSVTPP